LADEGFWKVEMIEFTRFKGHFKLAFLILSRILY
jgi:hypothetical protein